MSQELKDFAAQVAATMDEYGLSSDKNTYMVQEHLSYHAGSEPRNAFMATVFEGSEIIFHQTRDSAEKVIANLRSELRKHFKLPA